jgi:hypothetical protein
MTEHYDKKGVVLLNNLLTQVFDNEIINENIEKLKIFLSKAEKVCVKFRVIFLVIFPNHYFVLFF